MRPNPRLRMPSITGRVQVNIESRLVRMTWDHWSKVMRWKVPSRVMPALLTRMSTGPCSPSIALMPASQAAASETSNLVTGMPVSPLNLVAASSLPP